MKWMDEWKYLECKQRTESPAKNFIGEVQQKEKNHKREIVEKMIIKKQTEKR